MTKNIYLVSVILKSKFNAPYQSTINKKFYFVRNVFLRFFVALSFSLILYMLTPHDSYFNVCSYAVLTKSFFQRSTGNVHTDMIFFSDFPNHTYDDPN